MNPRDVVYFILKYAIWIGVIVGGFYAIRHTKSVRTDSTDDTAHPYEGGHPYWLQAETPTSANLAVNIAVAYHQPDQIDRDRIAWVAATEGQRISIIKRTDREGFVVMVDGKEGQFQPATIKNEMAEIRVPKGCVFLLARGPVKDSLEFGPIPLRYVFGKL